MCSVVSRKSSRRPYIRVRRRPRGVAALIALMFVALLSVLSMGIYSSTHLSTQVVVTQQRVDVAQLAAESGMEFIRLQLANVSIPYNTAPANLYAQLASDLQTQMNSTATLANGSIESDAATQTLYIPARNAPAIALGNGSGTFRCEVKAVGTQLTVKTTGYDNKGTFARDIQLNYAIAMRASNIFDFGVASKGPISMNGNVSIKGTAGNDGYGSVLVVSDSSTTPLQMIGSSSISGDVSLTRTNPQSISIGSSSTIAGYGSSSSNIWKHVHDKASEPEFPVVDTTVFKPYATTIIDANSGGGSMVGGSGSAAGFVGLTYLNLQNSVVVQGFDSVNSATLGSVSVLGQTNAGGNVNGTTFKGEYDYKTTLTQNGSTFTKTKKVNSTLTFANATTPSGTTNLGNYNGPAGAKDTFAGGKYYFTTFSVPSGKTVEFTGPVELYINGACNITGDVLTKDNSAVNTKIRMVSAAGVDLNGSATSKPLYLDVYAPQSPLNINNRPSVNGSFIMNGISVSNSTVNIDRAVKANGGATATPAAGSGVASGSLNITTKNLKNVLVKANSNPKFAANTTIDGVIFIERPNKVDFGGNVNINGIVVVETDGNNNIGLDPTQNTITFRGGVSVLPLSSLPATSDFPASLRSLSGAFLLAPGFGVSFGGNFGTIGGSIIASQIDYNGTAGGTVTGTVIQLNNTPFTMSGNSDITIQSTGTSSYPAGVFFGSRFDPLPDSYVEVQP